MSCTACDKFCQNATRCFLNFSLVIGSGSVINQLIWDQYVRQRAYSFNVMYIGPRNSKFHSACIVASPVPLDALTVLSVESSS